MKIGIVSFEDTLPSITKSFTKQKPISSSQSYFLRYMLYVTLGDSPLKIHDRIRSGHFVRNHHT